MANSLQVQKGASDRLKEILTKIEQKAPEETKQLAALVQAIQDHHIAVLGEDEAFKLIDSTGEIRAFRSVVHLSATDGTLVQPMKGGPFVISAQGYERWEEGAGAITMKPPHVLVGDTLVQNPHVERDPKNGRIMAIHCRTIAFRFTSKGIPQVSDWTTIFDVPAYRLIDLLAKAKAFPQAFRLLPNELEPENGGRETWAHYPFDENTTLWVNTSHEEALQFYSQIINREKKAMDFAQTFSKRNSLKHLSGLQKVPGQDASGGGTKPIPVWSIPIISWRPTSGSIIKWDMTRYSNVAKALTKAAGGDTQALMIEASKGTEYVESDPGITREMEEIEQAEGEGESGAAAGNRGEDFGLSDRSTEQATSPATITEPGVEGAEATPQPHQEERKEPPPPAEKGQKESPGPLFGKDNSPMAQFKALQKQNPALAKQAMKECEIYSVMSESGALLVLKKANEIAKRPPEPTKRK